MRNHVARLRGFTRSRRVRYAAAVLAAVLAAGTVVALRSAGEPKHDRAAAQPRAAHPAGAQQAAQLAAADQPRSKPLTLLTGDKVSLTPVPGGRTTVSVRPPAPSRKHPHDSFAQTFQVGGDTYSVPAPALRQLGKQLDPRLFDVSYLQRAGYADLAALPVTIDWRSATHAPIPGLTSPARGTHTSGSVRLSTATRFALALSAGLPDVRRISLAAAPTATSTDSATAPAVPLSSSTPTGTQLYTLTVGVTGTTGEPAFAVIAVQNLRSFQQYYSIHAVAPGEQLSVSVPAGPYGIEATIYDLFADTLPTDMAFVPVSQVDVASDTAITVDARQAKPIDVSVPQDAAPELAALSYRRDSADHFGIESTLFTLGPGIVDFLPDVHLFAKPTPAPRLGSLGFAHSWELVPPGSGFQGVDAPYTYSLDFASADGVPSDLTHALTDADLAAVHENIAASVPDSSAYFAYVPFRSWSRTSFALFPTFLDFPVPTQRVDYFGGSDATVWALSSQLVQTSQLNPPAIFAAYRTFHPGQDVTMTWGASPAVPAPEWQSVGLPAGSASLNGVSKTTYSYVCPVCRQGDLLSFNVPVSGDNDPTHTEGWFGVGSGALSGPVGHPTDSLKFWRNGTLSQVSARSGLLLPMLPGDADYKIEWASTIPVGWTRLATSVDSVWTFSSARPSAPDQLPSYELCSPDSAQACAFMPLIFASYDFGADLTGDVPAPGTETFTLTGYYEAGVTAPAVDHASVRVSFDDGATWTDAEVGDLGGGRFRVSIDQPDPSASSGYASVKVSLADGAGNTLDQTIMRAYALAGN